MGRNGKWEKKKKQKRGKRRGLRGGFRKKAFLTRESQQRSARHPSSAPCGRILPALRGTAVR